MDESLGLPCTELTTEHHKSAVINPANRTIDLKTRIHSESTEIRLDNVKLIFSAKGVEITGTSPVKKFIAEVTYLEDLPENLRSVIDWRSTNSGHKTLWGWLFGRPRKEYIYGPRYYATGELKVHQLEMNVYTIIR